MIKQAWTYGTHQCQPKAITSKSNKLYYEILSGDNIPAQEGTVIKAIMNNSYYYLRIQDYNNVQSNCIPIAVQYEPTYSYDHERVFDTLEELLTADGHNPSELLVRITEQEFYNPGIAYKFVDLGLPSGLLWATTNIGALVPEEFGLYFAWGETQGYSGLTIDKQFDWGDYELCKGSLATLTKYNNNSFLGKVDNLKTLKLEDDAAYISYNKCRMPTEDEYRELVNNTTSTWETLNGVNGRRFTSKTNSNSIFIPAAGSYYKGSADEIGSCGYLWSSTLNDIEPHTGWSLFFNQHYAYLTHYSRRDGAPIRAVKESKHN